MLRIAVKEPLLSVQSLARGSCRPLSHPTIAKKIILEHKRFIESDSVVTT